MSESKERIRPKFICHIERGIMKLIDREKYDQFVQFATDGDYFMTLTRKRRSRTDKQRRYYFGVIIRMIAMESYGEESKETMMKIHEFLKATYLKDFIEFRLPDGRILVEEIIKSTEDLNTVEEEEYHEECRRWASIELNLYIPLPNEVDWDSVGYYAI
jgi:hypothetical protein